MEEKKHICKYCFGHTSNADCVCTSCRAKLVQVRKLMKIGEMIKHGAEARRGDGKGAAACGLAEGR